MSTTAEHDAHEPHLMTLAEFVELPEDNSVRFELQEGVPVVTPRPRPEHQYALHKLVTQLEAQLPPELVALAEVDVRLDLEGPPTVRSPDVVVVHRHALPPPTILPSSAVVLAVEVISPGSRRTDRVTKSSEYADAHIPHYWLVDLDDEPLLIAHHLAGPFGYQEHPAVLKRLTTSEPVPLTIDVAALKPDWR
jgi:Uma2 family endonuclease